MFLFSVVSVLCCQGEATATDGPVQKSPAMFACALCVCVCVIGCNNNPLHQQWIGKRGWY